MKFSHRLGRVLKVAFAAFTCFGHAQLSHEQRQFEAYDCTSPQELRPVQQPPPKTCQDMEKAPVQQGKNESILVLQQATYRRQTAYRCKFVRTRVSHYCGDHDHQTFTPMMSKFAEQREVEPVLCRKMWRDKQYVGHHEKKFPLKVGPDNTFTELVVGTTSLYDNTDVQCVGGKTMHDGIPLLSMNVWEQQTIRLTEEIILVSESGDVTLHHAQIKLKCPFWDHECVYEQGTVYWKAPSPDEECKFHVIRKPSGVIVTGPSGTETFMSTDGAMVRLILKDTVTMCRGMGRRTNYRNLFVADPSQVELVSTKQIPLEEMSPLTYTNAQDDFLYSENNNFMVKEFRAVMAHQCSKDRSLSAGAGTSIEGTDGDTTSLGDGFMSTISGEVWYTYQCRLIVVVGQDTALCHSALPVELTANDRERMESALGVGMNKTGYPKEGLPPHLSRGPTGFFLEPHTRRVIHYGTVMPCTILRPLYVNTRGAWVQLDPKLDLTVEPETMVEYHQNEYVAGVPRKFDFGKSGIYDEEARRRFDIFTQTSRLRLDVGTTISYQTRTHVNPRHIAPSEMFVEVPKISFDLMARFGKFLDKWMVGVALISFACVIFKVCSFVIGVGARCMTAKKLFGWEWHMIAALCPSVMHWLVVRLGPRTNLRKRRKAPKGIPRVSYSAGNGGPDGDGSVAIFGLNEPRGEGEGDKSEEDEVTASATLVRNTRGGPIADPMYVQYNRRLREMNSPYYMMAQNTPTLVSSTVDPSAPPAATDPSMQLWINNEKKETENTILATTPMGPGAAGEFRDQDGAQTPAYPKQK